MNGLRLGSIMLASLGFLLLNSPVSAQNSLRADLESFQEVPAVSSPASGEFRAKVIKNTTIEYTLSYKGLEDGRHPKPYSHRPAQCEWRDRSVPLSGSSSGPHGSCASVPGQGRDRDGHAYLGQSCS